MLQLLLNCAMLGWSADSNKHVRPCVPCSLAELSTDRRTAAQYICIEDSGPYILYSSELLANC